MMNDAMIQTRRCGCCGRLVCVCDDRDFTECVLNRDRDAIISLIAERRRLEQQIEDERTQA